MVYFKLENSRAVGPDGVVYLIQDNGSGGFEFVTVGATTTEQAASTTAPAATSDASSRVLSIASAFLIVSIAALY